VRIDITLGGALIQFLPPDESGNQFTYTHESSVSLSELLGTLGIGRERRLLTILNGNVIHPDAFGEIILNDGDALSLMPPIVAG